MTFWRREAGDYTEYSFLDKFGNIVGDSRVPGVSSQQRQLTNVQPQNRTFELSWHACRLPLYTGLVAHKTETTSTLLSAAASGHYNHTPRQANMSRGEHSLEKTKPTKTKYKNKMFLQIYTNKLKMKTNENGLFSARCANHPLVHDRRGPFPKSKMEQMRRRHTHKERSKRRVQLQCLKIGSHHKS